MMQAAKAGTLLLLLTLTTLLVGCGGSGGGTLATVDDYDITVQEFDNFFPVGDYVFANAQDEFDRKRERLDSLIVTHLLINAAYESGLDRSEELAHVVLANKDRFLLDILLKKEVADKATVSDAEVRDFWEHLKYKIRASHIVVKDPDTAQALFERLQNGESFDKLAFEYSIDPSAKKNKGDLGYFTWGALVDEVQEAAFKMEPGELSPPIKSGLGYHLIKLVDKLPNEQRRDFDLMKADLKQQIMQRKQYMRQRKFFEEISEKYPVTIDTTTCAYVLHKRSQIYPPMLLETLPRNDFDVEQLDRNERELIIGSWEGGQMTLLEYLTEIQKIPANYRPSFDAYDSLALVIAAIKRSDVLVTEAYRRGLDSDPELIRKLKLFREYTMADMYRNDSIPKPPPPDDGVLRMYYDKHPAEFTTPPTYHVYEILLTDEPKAMELKNSINTEDRFKEKALELSERPGKRALQGDLGYISRGLYPEIYDLASKTKVGTIGGPVVTRGKYSIFWVADKTEEELKDYLGVKRQIYEELVAKNNQQAFTDWVDQHRQQANISVNEDVLWRTINMEKYPDEEETSS